MRPNCSGPRTSSRSWSAPHRHGATTSLDFLIGGDPAFYGLIEPLLEHADYVLPNAEQALGWTGEADLPAAARALHAAGAKIVAVTDGARDIIVVEGGDIERVPIVAAEPVDTSGGGDAFSAGFVFARLRGEGRSPRPASVPRSPRRSCPASAPPTAGTTPPRSTRCSAR